MATAEYANTTDYALLTNRFKLLNLVQRVAHRDVLEMIETVGLEAVTFKGTLERWQPGAPSLHLASPETTTRRAKLSSHSAPQQSSSAARTKSSSSPTGALPTNQDRPAERFVFTRGSSRQEAKVAAARSALGNADANTSAEAQRPARSQRLSRPLRRTPAEQEAFYSRLAAPRERPEDVFIDHVEILPGRESPATAPPRRSPPPLPSRPTYGNRGGDYDDEPPHRGARRFEGPPSHAYGRQTVDSYGYPSYPPYPYRTHRQTPPDLPDPRVWRGGESDMYYDAPVDPYGRPVYGRDAEAPPRRVRFDDEPHEAPHATTWPPPLPQQRDEQQLVQTALVPAPGTDSEGSGPADVNGTAPRGDAAARGDNTLPTPAPADAASPPGLTVPALPLSELDDPHHEADEVPAAVSTTEEEGTGIVGASTSSGRATPSAVTRRQRATGLRPKAKPQGALDSPRVPMEAIQHAASALLAQSHAARSQAAMHSQANASTAARGQFTRGGGGEGGYHTQPLPTRRASDPVGGPASSPPQRLPVDGGDQWGADTGLPPVASPVPAVPVTAGAHTALPRPPPATFAEVSSTIDHMLLDHQRILHQLVRPDRQGADANSSGEQSALFSGDAASMDISFSRPHHSQPGRYTALSREQQRQIMQAHLLGDGSLSEDAPQPAGPMHGQAGTTASRHSPADDDEEEEDLVDEMLLYSRLQNKVASMDADLARIERAHAAERQQEMAGPPPSAVRPADKATQPPAGPAHRRRTGADRGTMPEAVIRRLQAFRKENYESIAYNEKLWNTSQVSQFAFAQRLTNALAQDCLEEVLAEVSDIMDDYVEGLADHELR